MATHSSTLAWKILWMEEPGGLQSMGSRRVGHDFTFTFTFRFHALEKEMATHSSALAWKIPGTVEPGGLLSMGLHRVGHDQSDAAAAAGQDRARKPVWAARNVCPNCVPQERAERCGKSQAGKADVRGTVESASVVRGLLILPGSWEVHSQPP